MPEPKYSLIPQSFLDLIVEINATAKTLKERVDIHSFQNNNKFDELFKRVDNLRENQFRNKEDLVNQIHSVNLYSKTEMTRLGTKVALIASGLVSGLGLVGHWIMEKIK